MRNFFGTLGVICGLIIVALVGDRDVRAGRACIRGLPLAPQQGRGCHRWADRRPVAELIILICLIGWEVSREKTPTSSRAELELAAKGTATKAEEIGHEPALAKLLTPPRPRLVASSVGKPAGSIVKTLTAVLEAAKGERVELAEAYSRYCAECVKDGNPAVTPDHFVDPLVRFCKGAGIRTKQEGDMVYILNVKLVDARARSA